ncbi:tail fiber protein [Niabella sp. CC-SYL272]|uniref:phage tail protein n=1 Tax=Niabella agricola TaxID=2891571 RepID=UPI001F27CF27|nr:tail fiber protein [Niabella agricola]MCF3111448.1 tail fiber protein [Niabella agricola]
MEPFLGMIALFGFNFAPLGWTYCNGQLLPIAQNDALFALLGTTFGGDGITTFALPDLRGRVPIGMGASTPNTSNRNIGENGGTETATLTTANLPAHNHPVFAVAEAGDASAPAGAYLANTGTPDKEYRTTGTAVTMHANMVQPAGLQQPYAVIQPVLGLNFCISTEGIFPSRG